MNRKRLMAVGFTLSFFCAAAFAAPAPPPKLVFTVYVNDASVRFGPVKPIPNANVKITYGGDSWYGTTDAAGVAKVRVLQYATGTYQFQVSAGKFQTKNDSVNADPFLRDTYSITFDLVPGR